MTSKKFRFLKWLVYGVILLVLLGAVDFFLNFTLYNPTFIVPLYGKLQQYSLFRDHLFKEVGVVGEGQYPLVDMWELNHGLYPKARAMVLGSVEAVVKAGDGDWHINVRDEHGNVLVAEISPEYPLAFPQIGARIKLWGITRYDIEHRWWEIHPVFGWHAQ